MLLWNLSTVCVVNHLWSLMHWYRMIAKTRAGSSKSFHETLHTKLLFPGIWLASPSRSSPNYWTHRFPVKAFRENVILCRTLCDVILCRKYHGILNLTFYSFGWRLLLCRHETLSSNSVVFFVWKPLKYYHALLLSPLYEEVSPTKTTIYI